MPDIMRFILNENKAKSDPQANLLSLDDWSLERAQQLAASERIQLSERHIDVLTRLRDHYRVNGPWKNARATLKTLEQIVTGSQARRKLYVLFPGGPVRQACKLAGLPVPAEATHPSFGSVH